MDHTVILFVDDKALLHGIFKIRFDNAGTFVPRAPFSAHNAQFGDQAPESIQRIHVIFPFGPTAFGDLIELLTLELHI